MYPGWINWPAALNEPILVGLTRLAPSPLSANTTNIATKSTEENAYLFKNRLARS
jgi:hypothetical protein